MFSVLGEKANSPGGCSLFLGNLRGELVAVVGARVESNAEENECENRQGAE